MQPLKSPLHFFQKLIVKNRMPAHSAGGGNNVPSSYVTKILIFFFFHQKNCKKTKFEISS
jgi:hypothetical protein